MPSKDPIPVYRHFNHSLLHLHLPPASASKLYHVFKWEYTKDIAIHYPASRQQYFDITFFVKARFTHHLNTNKFSIINHSLHFLTPGQAEQFDTTTMQRASGFGMYFMPSFLFGTLQQQKLERDLSFLKNGNRNVFYLTPAQSAILQQIFENAITESNLLNDDIVRHYLVILLYKIKAFGLPQANRRKESFVHNKLVLEFEKMIRQTYLEPIKINDYAARLHVTTRTLSDAVQKETGKTPKQLLQEMILTEAKLLLLHSSMQVAEISAQLNFHDTPHFTRFFTKETGLGPQQFRKAQEQ
jgi:AraC family transcriptional regulator, transcriptional activator of pobA